MASALFLQSKSRFPLDRCVRFWACVSGSSACASVSLLLCFPFGYLFLCVALSFSFRCSSIVGFVSLVLERMTSLMLKYSQSDSNLLASDRRFSPWHLIQKKRRKRGKHCGKRASFPSLFRPFRPSSFFFVSVMACASPCRLSVPVSYCSSALSRRQGGKGKARRGEARSKFVYAHANSSSKQSTTQQRTR